ncbi:MAG TPA: PadR family transcriptional regulator [Gemmatimonadaceae bacterium]|nr:PadR family transcriptional regulator [Gemmatimonadaceae bacterium]
MADAESHLPLTPIVLHVLLALSDGEKHGYAIAQDIERADPGIPTGPGSLYGSIHRMLAASLIEERTPRKPAANEDPRRRFYGLTPLGKRVLHLEVERLAAIVKMARKRHLLDQVAARA